MLAFYHTIDGVGPLDQIRKAILLKLEGRIYNTWRLNRKAEFNGKAKKSSLIPT